MSKADQAALAEFGKAIIEIFEDYSSWPNVEEYKPEVYERVANAVFNFGAKLDG